MEEEEEEEEEEKKTEKEWKIEFKTSKLNRFYRHYLKMVTNDSAPDMGKVL